MPAMSDYRRSAGPGQGERSLPILFHLIDVSRPPPQAPGQQASAPAEERVEPIVSSPPEPHQPAAPLTIAPPVSSERSLLEATPLRSGSTLMLSPLGASPSLVETQPPVTQPLSSGLSSAVEAALHTTARAAAASDVLTSTAKSQQTLTPRSQLSSRQRKTPVSEEWFAAHGKFIALAFVLALIGIMYFGRSSRRPPPATAAVEHNPSPATDVSPAKPAPPAGVQPSHIAEAGSKKPEASGDKLVESGSAASESAVDLHPPATATAPQLAAGSPADQKPQGKDNLFVFPSSKPADERVASRPATPAFGPTPPTVQQPAPAVAGAAPASSQPVMSPAYPTTSSPAPPYLVTQSPPPSGYPQTSAPPLVGPAAPASGPAPAPTGYSNAYQASPNPAPNYRSQYPLPVAPAPPLPQAWPPAPGSSLPGQHQPLDNSARGPRYERTGPGTY